MPRQLIVVAGDRDRSYLPTYLAETFPALDARVVADLPSLRAAFAGREDESRILTFLTDIIIPADILAATPLQAVNIHPGPPNYRGSCPDGFAWLDGAREFGVTAHELTTDIDAGRILSVRRFPTPLGATREDIANRAFEECLVLFALVVRHFARTNAPLPPAAERWSGPARTRAQFRKALQAQRVMAAAAPTQSTAS